MRRSLSILIAAIPALTLAACAPGQTDPSSPTSRRAERQCFMQAQITNFRADRANVYVRAGTQAVYELQTAGACLDIDDSMQLAVVPLRGSSTLCVGDRVNLLARSPSPPSPCSAYISRRLTDEEVAALPSRLRP